jgi:hypothetical protein
MPRIDDIIARHGAQENVKPLPPCCCCRRCSCNAAKLTAAAALLPSCRCHHQAAVTVLPAVDMLPGSGSASGCMEAARQWQRQRWQWQLCSGGQLGDGGGSLAAAAWQQHGCGGGSGTTAVAAAAWPWRQLGGSAAAAAAAWQQHCRGGSNSSGSAVAAVEVLQWWAAWRCYLSKGGRLTSIVGLGRPLNRN